MLKIDYEMMRDATLFEEMISTKNNLPKEQRELFIKLLNNDKFNKPYILTYIKDTPAIKLYFEI